MNWIHTYDLTEVSNTSQDLLGGITTVLRSRDCVILLKKKSLGDEGLSINKVYCRIYTIVAFLKQEKNKK